MAPRIPGYLVVMVFGTPLTRLFYHVSALPDVDTIAARFHCTVDGSTFSGIPSVGPSLALPWATEVDSIPKVLSLFQSVFGAAFAIAILGALESLLCATVADGMTGRQRDPDGELAGQGNGNTWCRFSAAFPPLRPSRGRH